MLVECGFMSNAEEESKLVTPEYQRKIAYAIYSGITGVLALGPAFVGIDG